jgi:hypothetical protein
VYEFGPPRTGLHCTVCRTHRVIVSLLPGGDAEITIIHPHRCPTKWRPALKRKVGRDVIDQFTDSGMFVADYWMDEAGEPRHMYAPVVIE